ncbi:hypothetical protein SKAU_G00157860 [Synaphobranchus kaupii]|uniref:Uncharacterized protein n=1 Tax=Synaphobranchus kaupii TaxID=118154 RepID=A0A9Q1FI15_SYNKA|nr:hypothetical protein SKAU_G00157860 [Synaphobranchus kaupii]
MWEQVCFWENSCVWI